MRKKHPSILQAACAAAALACALAGCAPDSPEEATARENARMQKALDEVRAQAAQQTLEQTLEALEALNARYPNRPALLEEIALAYAQAKRPIEAGFFFEETARLDPARASALLFAAEIYTEQSDWEGAARALQNYVILAPADAVALKKLAQAYAELNRPKSAVEAYLEALKRRDTQPLAPECAQIGGLFQSLGNRTQAGQWYLRALECADEDGAHEAARLGLLEMAIAQKDWDGCARAVEELDTHHPGALDKSRLAQIREDLKAYEAARESLRAVSFKAPTADEMLASIEAREIELLPAQDSQNAPEGAHAPEGNTQNAPETSAENAVTAPQADDAPAPEVSQPKEPATESTEAQSLAAAAEVALADNRAQEAFDLYWRALPLDEGNAALWDRLSVVAAALGKHAEAKIFAMEARNRAPENIDIAERYLDRVRAADSDEDYAAQVARVRAEFPPSAALTYRLARALETAHPTAARKLYAQLLSDFPDSPEAERVRALASAEDAAQNAPENAAAENAAPAPESAAPASENNGGERPSADAPAPEDGGESPR